MGLETRLFPLLGGGNLSRPLLIYGLNSSDNIS